MQTTSLARRALPALAAAGVAAALFAAPSDARAKGSVNPVTLHLSSLTVGPATEFRLAVVHPVFAPRFDAADGDLVLAAGLVPDKIIVGAAGGGRRTKVPFGSFHDKAALFVPGEMLRTGSTDYVVRRHRIAAAGGKVDLPVGKVSPDPSRKAAPEEPRLLKTLLPPSLRWYAVEEDKSKVLTGEVENWARLAELPPAERSAAALGSADLIGARVAEYVRELGRASPSPAGTDLVGYAAVLDGEVAIVETFGAASLYGPVRARALQAIAVEASLLEVRQDLLTQDIPDSGEPDRYITDVKQRLLALYGPKPSKSRVKALGSEYAISAASSTSARALVVDDKVIHCLVTVQPGRRKVRKPGEELEPGVIDRKSRPTAGEERYGDRRKDRDPPPPPPAPPPR